MCEVGIPHWRSETKVAQPNQRDTRPLDGDSMTVNVCYEKDTNAALLKNKTIAVLGFGSQGQAHAQNLRDSGFNVIVAQRPGGPNHALAIKHGFSPMTIKDAVQTGDLLISALPDETVGEIYPKEIEPNLLAGQALGFIHGFAIRFGLVTPPDGIDVIMVAPKGPGSLVRSAFQRGGGLPCMIAVHQDATGQAKQLALAWGSGIGGGKGGLMDATFAIECEADLFGEQTTLCGGILELMKAAYDTLVDAGFPEEVAYFECVHEVKQIVDMQYAAGLAGMRSRISNTAAYGGLTRGPRLVTDDTRREMRTILAEIQSGQFAQEWIEECQQGKPNFASLMEQESRHASEPAGKNVRSLAQRAVSPPADTPPPKSSVKPRTV